MTRKKALGRWETKIGNSEVTPQGLWSITKSLLKRDRTGHQTPIHDLSGLKFYPSDKANVIADCLENQSPHHDIHDENHERGWRLEFKLYSKP
jgi:hypothetical protein